MPIKKRKSKKKRTPKRSARRTRSTVTRRSQGTAAQSRVKVRRPKRGSKRKTNATRLSAADIARLSPAARAQIGSVGGSKKTGSTSRKKRKRAKSPTKGQYRGFKAGRSVGRAVKSVYRGVRSAGRGLMHGIKNPAAGKRTNPKKVKRVFQEFRGKPVTRISAPIKVADGTPKHLASLGRLKELRLRRRTLRFGPRAQLGASGRKRLFIGGVRLRDRSNPGVETDQGEILGICYYADKPHLDQTPGYYDHSFGEHGGVRPRLIIDREGYPRIQGGSYTITSRGIEG